MAEHQVLFCPFCRESFEGQATCPDHELALVRFDRLPASATLLHEDHDDEQHDHEQARKAASIPLEDRALGPLEWRYGRGLVALGAALELVAFASELVHVRGYPTARVYALAQRVPGLGALPLVGFTLCFVLARRRTPRKLRGLRVLVPLLASVAPANLAWAYWLLQAGEATRAPPGAAIYVALVASLLLVVGGLRLGRPPRSSELHAHD